MDCVVCIKQVPASANIRLDPETHTLVRSGAQSELNPFDLYALEAALRIREAAGGSVTVISMGIPSTVNLLRYALGLGADKAVLLSSPGFAGSDTWATAYTLAHAIQKCGRFDLVLCGKQAIDGDTAQVGPSLAEKLGIPHAAYVSQISGCSGSALICKKMTDEGYESVRMRLPGLITVVKEINTPRFMTLAGYRRAADQYIPVWTPEDLGLDRTQIGLKGSPTRVVKTFTPDQHKDTRMFTGTPRAAAALIVEALRGKGFAKDQGEGV